MSYTFLLFCNRFGLRKAMVNITNLQRRYRKSKNTSKKTTNSGPFTNPSLEIFPVSSQGRVEIFQVCQSYVKDIIFSLSHGLLLVAFSLRFLALSDFLFLEPFLSAAVTPWNSSGYPLQVAASRTGQSY